MLGATMAFIYIRCKTMTKQTCYVGSHDGTFWVAPEYWRTRQVHERKPVLPDITDRKREKRCLELNVGSGQAMSQPVLNLHLTCE